MADSSRIAGERVMCHSCQNEWQRSHGGLTCPNCESDFAEILEDSPSPESFPTSEPSSRPLSPFQPTHPFHNHNPWADAPDPDEDDISTFQFNTTGGGRATISFSTQTYTTRGNGRNVMPNPDMADLVHNFTQMLTNIMGLQNSRRGFPNDPMMASPFPFGGFTTASRTTFQTDPHSPHNMPQTANLNDIFSLVFNSINTGGPQQQQAPGQPPSPFALLSQLFNPANARHGDAVFSQEAFDRVMSQLMEQNAGSTAPGPASEAAIQSLSTKQVDKEMLGNDGKAECSICMDNVEVGDEVTVLPCNHWFHGQCVTAWLKEHDTCPHCRKPITNPEEGNQQQQPGSRQRPSRRSSSVASPRSQGVDGSRRNPFTIPDSPSELREARQQYYGMRIEREDRPRSHHHSSNSESRVRRRDSRSEGGSGSNGGGGVGGWIRNHMPFQG